MVNVNKPTGRSKYVTYWEYLDKDKPAVTPSEIVGYDGIFPDEIIARAAELRGYNEAYYKDRKTLEGLDEEPILKLTDLDFIKFALQERYESVVRQIDCIHQREIAQLDIPDPQWAAYTYEEIIAMAENGVNIPDEVVAWAKAQQQADPMSYEIDVESSESQGAEQGAESAASVQKKAKEYAEKAEKAIDETLQLFESHRDVAQKAMRIKKAKEDKYKSEMDDIAKMTEEWKALNAKSSAGTLTKAENKRFSELSRKLNGKNGTAMKDMQMADAQLDKYLDSFEIIDTKIDENSTLIQETKEIANSLLKIEKPCASELMPHSKTEKEVGHGLLSDLKFGAKGDNLSAATMEAAEDLKECNDDVTEVIRGRVGTELTQFAKDYTTEATKNEENTKEVMGDAFNQASPERKLKKSVDSGIPIIFSFMNAILASTLTILTTAELLAKDKETKTEKKSLNKELKKADKDMKALNKEVDEAENKKESNRSEEEVFLAKLDEINTKSTEPTKSKDPDSADPNGNEASNNGEEQDIIKNLENIGNKDKQASKSLNKALTKSTKTTNKSKSIAKILKGKTTNLGKYNQKAIKTALDTTVVGVGTTALSVVTNLIGTELCATGSFMIGCLDPTTVTTGFKLLDLGAGFLKLSELELGTGLAATRNGAATLAISAMVDDNIKDANASEKDANKVVKENKKEIQASAKALKKNSSTETATAAAATAVTATVTTSASTAATASATTTSAPTTSGGEATEAGAEQQANAATQTAGSGDSTTSETPNENPSNNKNSENDEGNDANKQEQGKGGVSKPSVDIGFTIPHCIAANVTVSQSTNNVLNRQRKVEADRDEYLGNLDIMEKLNKKIKKNQGIVEKLEQAKAQKIENISKNIETSNTDIENANKNGETDKAAVAQIDLDTQTAELETVAQDTKSSNALAKSLNDGNKQLKVLEGEKGGLKTNLDDYNKEVANHLDNCQDTIVTGSGTIGVGIGYIAAGVPLTFNPATKPAGIALIVTGLAHRDAGLSSIITGSTGLTLHGEASGHVKDIRASLKSGDPKIKNGKNSLKRARTSAKAAEKITETALSAVPDTATSSASASTNANTTSSVETDDKVDRKLARFNNDSIIESKKKKKKVQGVSASSRG